MTSTDKSASPPAFQPEAYGRYYLVDKIAIGGMAEVFKARRFSDGGFQMLLVIKRILEQFSENDEFVQMFVDEAKISVQLQHPNIVQLYDFGKLSSNYFIAMECVEGKDLKGLLRALAHRRKLLPQEFAVYIAHEICKGLDYAHKKTDIEGRPLHIVHRDISPSNILLSYGGDVKIADFGIAKAQTSAYTTKDGVLKGKFEYMSPEQASGQSATCCSDIFSAGILLHEMLTGRRLFKTDSDIKTLEKIKTLDIQPPSTRNPRVPAALDELVMKALSLDPCERFRDSKEMQLALAEHLYPAIPSMTRDNLSEFLQELFRDNINAERHRLQVGTQLATNLHEQALAPDMETEEWTAGFTAATLQIQQQQQPRRTSLLLLLLILILPISMIAVIAYPYLQPAPEEVAPATGTLQVSIRPTDITARFYINDTLITEDSSMISEVSPDTEVILRIEADGFLPHEESLSVTAGERLRLPVFMQPEPEPEPEPEPVVTPTPVRVPRPPVVRQPDPEPVAAPVEAPVAASVAEPEPEPEPEPATGTLRLQARGTWGNVYINDRMVGTTPLTKDLPPGTYSIRVENPETGYTNSTSVTIISGQLTKTVL